MNGHIGPNFKVGDYLYTYFDTGGGKMGGPKEVYLRVVKICPKMVWLRSEHWGAFRKSRSYVENLYALHEGDWHPKIPLSTRNEVEI